MDRKHNSKTSPPTQSLAHAPRPMPITPTSDPAAAGLPSVRKHRTLEDLAYEDIRRAISDGRFAPGDRIVVKTLAAASGISKIPIMQALRRLETEGFVRINPHKDIVVTKASPEEYRERFLLIAALEALCVREAAEKTTPEVIKQLRTLQDKMVAARKAKDTARAATLDTEFHRIFWEAAGLPQTLRILQNLWDQGEYYRIIMHARRGGFAKESLAEHEEILEALEANDLLRAARNTERHHLLSMDRLTETT